MSSELKNVYKNLGCVLVVSPKKERFICDRETAQKIIQNLSGARIEEL